MSNRKKNSLTTVIPRSHGTWPCPVDKKWYRYCPYTTGTLQDQFLHCTCPRRLPSRLCWEQKKGLPVFLGWSHDDKRFHAVPAAISSQTLCQKSRNTAQGPCMGTNSSSSSWLAQNFAGRLPLDALSLTRPVTLVPTLTLVSSDY